jgi:hypothetical protein
MMQNLQSAAWTGLRWLFALFFFATGLLIVFSLLTGTPGPITQPTAAAAALDRAFHESGIIDPAVAASYLAGGAALAIRRTAPLGLVLLAPAVTIILLFDVVLARLPVPGLAVALVWAVLALRHLAGFRCLWNFGHDH